MRRLVTAIVAGSLLLTVGCQVGPRVNFVEHDDKIEVVTSGHEFTDVRFTVVYVCYYPETGRD